MGYLTLGRRFLGVVHDIIDDRIDVVMRGTQALTVGCARCHDHKFDPISIKDYYALYGVFNGSTERTVPLVEQPAKTEAYLAYEKELKIRVDKLNQTFATKCAELSNRIRTKSVEYLVAVLDAAKLPNEEFYEIRGPDDLNPVVVRRWQAYLFQTSKEFHPIFGPWHALAAVPEKQFVEQSPAIIRQLVNATDPTHRVNALVAKTLSDSAPASM